MSRTTTSPAPGRSTGRARRTSVRLLRRWRRSDLRLALSERRLTLRGLSPGHQVLTIACLVAMLVSGTAIVVVSVVDPGLPSLVNPVALQTEPRPPLLIATLLLDLVVGQVVLAALATAQHRGFRWTGLTGSVALGLASLASLVFPVRLTDAIYTGQGAQLTVTVLGVVAGVGAAALAAGAALALRPPTTASRRRRPAAAALMVVPVVAFAVTWAAVRATGTRFAGSADHRFPDSLPLSTVLEARTEALVLIMAGLGMVATLWQATGAARAARDSGHAAARGAFRLLRPPGSTTASRHAWEAVAVLMGVKLLWVVAGLTGTAPWWLGGGFDLWEDSAADGWLSWSVAVVLSGVAITWLLRGCKGPGEDDAAWSVGIVLVGVLVLPEVLFQGLAAIAITANVEVAVDVARAVEIAQPWVPVVACVGCAVAAGWRHRTGRRDSGTLLLAVFAVWAGLRVPALVHDLVTYPWFPWGLSMPSESQYGRHQGWVNLATVDATLTAGLTAVALLAVMGRLRVRMLPILLLGILPLLLVYPADLVALLMRNDTWTGIGFLLPVAYLFLADAEALNRPGPRRTNRLLAVLLLSVLALMVGVVRGARGDPAAPADQDFAFALVLVPVLVVSVVATLSRSSRPATRSG